MVKRLPLFLPLILLVALLSACGLLREPEQASGTIEAIPLEITEQPAATPTAAATVEPVEEASAATAPSATGSGEGDVQEPTHTPESAQETAGIRIFQISQADSRVRFEIDEELRGEPKTVVGVTDQVAGEIALDFSDLSTAQIGVIQINARTLQTDSDRRDRAIQNEILDTGAYEFITFTPSAVNDLPNATGIGEEVAFTVDGDLTIRDVTQPATFDVVATAVSESEVRGTAVTTIDREAFGLRIPSVPMVANVEEEVELYIEFVARTG